MEKLLTLDIGTTSVKTSIFDKNLKMLSLSNEEYQLITGPNNNIELNADTYWEAVKKGIRDACKEAGIEGNEITAITITTQGETLIPVNNEGRALRNAIVWLDGRAAEESEFISKKFEAGKFYSITGLPECNGFCPVSKLLWVKNNEPEIYANGGKLSEFCHGTA